MPTIYWLAAATFIFVYLASKVVKFYVHSYRLREIPTLGSSSIFSYHASAYKFIIHGREMLQEGYDKYRGSAFKVAQLTQWHVFISGHDMIEDLRRATDDQVSFREAVLESLQLKNLYPKSYGRSIYHVNVIRGALTRNIAIRFPEVRDEIVAAFTEEIPVKSEWVKVPVMDIIRRVVSRTSNRLFVGLPLCRNSQYRDLNIDFTVTLVTTARHLLSYPAFLRPLLARVLNTVPSKIKLALELVGPMIKERLEKDEQYGPKWEGRPNDLISWLLDEAPPDQRNVYDLTLRVLMSNMAAIHTTSNTFTSSMYYLAAHPEYIQPLREEIEMVIEADGWSKASVGKMYKLDSFLKEVQRMSGGIAATSMTRTVLKDFTFSNGVTVPAGTFISAASHPIHLDEDNYPAPDDFKPFRFAELREGEALKHHMVTPSHEYLLFGHGRHACPGRFFAVNELKVMMAHVLLTYDVKLEDDKRTPPPPRWFGASPLPDSKAKVLFRARSSCL